METINEDIAYWAGFIDGEGSILISKHEKMGKWHRNHVYILQVIVANTNKELMEQFREFVGTNTKIAERRFKRVNQRNAFYLCITGPTARRLLEKLEPYLKLKKKQALLGIEFERNKEIHFPLTKEDVDYRILMQQKIRFLNRLDSNKGSLKPIELTSIQKAELMT